MTLLPGMSTIAMVAIAAIGGTAERPGRDRRDEAGGVAGRC
jgi:hypothetical protein